MLRRTMHTLAVIGLLSITVIFTTGATLGANAPNSTQLSQKSSVGSGVAKKSVDAVKPTGIGTLNTKKVGQVTPKVNPAAQMTPIKVRPVRDTGETYPACISKCDYCVMVIGTDGIARQDCKAHDKCISDCFDSTR